MHCCLCLEICTLPAISRLFHLIVVLFLECYFYTFSLLAIRCHKFYVFYIFYCNFLHAVYISEKHYSSSLFMSSTFICDQSMIVKAEIFGFSMMKCVDLMCVAIGC